MSSTIPPTFRVYSPDNDDTMEVTPEFWQELVGIDFRRAFPDMQVTIASIAAEGDIVFVHYTLRGTYKVPLSIHDALPSGVLETWDGIFIFRIEDGKIVEEWWYWVNSVF